MRPGSWPPQWIVPEIACSFLRGKVPWGRAVHDEKDGDMEIPLGESLILLSFFLQTPGRLRAPFIFQEDQHSGG